MHDDKLYLMHYGTKRHSGRYPWGSGEDPYQHESSFLSSVDNMRKEGMTSKEIWESLGMSSKEFRERIGIERAQKEDYDRRYILKLKEKGYSNTAIAERMGKNESYIRYQLGKSEAQKSLKLNAAVDLLKQNVDEKQFIDIGLGTNYSMNTSEQVLNNAVRKLKDEGYKVYYIKVEQLGTGKQTTMKILCPPGTEWKELNNNKDKIRTVTDYISDDGRTILNIKPPKNVSSDRIKVNYAEEGGAGMDGVIQLRRGVEDLSLGNSNYAQVRIAVDDTHYLKGMAVYADDSKFPEGVDIIFNTNKHVGTPKMKALKGMKVHVEPEDLAKQMGKSKEEIVQLIKDDKLKVETTSDMKSLGFSDKKIQECIDRDNPFGATINRQSGALNIVNEEGDWDKWTKSLASQMLSKQSDKLAKRQLDLAYSYRKDEFNTINSLTNPAIKEKLLLKFAESCDKGAETLKAASLPRQSSKVILPITSLKDNEIYAPGYRNGEEVVLIRYPHGGVFEIPRLKVNINNEEAKSVMFNAPDAVGINANVASKLSGADFDGDSVLVIPTATVKIKTSDSLEGLKNFDPKEAYPGYPGMKVISEANKQKQMGIVSNLITDMTLKGAPDDEIARAVRHSMVIIDSKKHELNWKASFEDNNIAELHEKWQGKKKGGAATLISKAKSPYMVPQRKETVKIDPETGKKIYTPTGELNLKGKPKIQESTKMREAEDARELSSGTRMEEVYAQYANDMKALGNLARKTSLGVEHYKASPSAKETYKEEVASLDAKLKRAKLNAPRERQAQIYANEVVKMKKSQDDELEYDKDKLKRVKNQALAAARARFGANKKDVQIEITDKEWEAIQNRAISYSKLQDIIDNTDLDAFKERAMPREQKAKVSETKANLIRSMHNAGYSLNDIAERIGVSSTTVSKVLKEG